MEKWCVATISGTVDKFEDEWGGEINAKQKRKMNGDSQAAVAASPATPVAAVSDDIEQPATPVAAVAAMTSPATPVAASQPEDSQ